nr:hypothetical protein [Rhizobium sp. ACO-34A]
MGSNPAAPTIKFLISQQIIRRFRVFPELWRVAATFFGKFFLILPYHCCIAALYGLCPLLEERERVAPEVTECGLFRIRGGLSPWE